MSMNTNPRQVVVGVFQDRGQAERAIDDLHQNGFTDDQIGFVVRNGQQTQGEITPAANAGPNGGDVAGGVVTGGILGGLIGAGAALLIPGIGPAVAGGILAATLGGAAIGAAAGGIIGALTSMGVPENEARYYQGEFEQGRTIVTVRAGARTQLAEDILQRDGAYNAHTRQANNAMYNTPPAATTTTTVTPRTTSTATTSTYSQQASNWETAAPQYRNNWQQRYGKAGGQWEDYEPGYRYGWQIASNPQYQGRDWAQLEPEFRRTWELNNPGTPWDRVSRHVREAWDNERAMHNQGQGNNYQTYNQS